MLNDLAMRCLTYEFNTSFNWLIIAGYVLSIWQFLLTECKHNVNPGLTSPMLIVIKQPMQSGECHAKGIIT